MAKGNVNIKITGDASGAKRAFKDAEGASQGLTGKFKNLVGATGKLATAMGGMYAAYKVVDFLKDSAQAAMEDAKAKAVLHAAIKNITGATEDELAALDEYIEKTQAATGFTEEELRPAMVKLTEATKDTEKAQELLAIAMDVSTARGVSLETVALALEKAQNGQLTSLQRLGVATKDASGAALSFDQILKNLADTYGGTTAAAADTFAGKLKRTQLVMGEIKESVGAAMLPALEQIASVIVDNMPTIEKLMTAFGDVAAEVLTLAADVVEDLMPAIDELLKLWETVWPLLKSAIQAVAPAIGTLLAGIVTAINAIIRSVTWLLDKIGLLKKEAAGMGIGAGISASKSWQKDLGLNIKGYGAPKNLPSWDVGGRVNAPSGQPVLGIVHGGEHVSTQADMADVVAGLDRVYEAIVNLPRQQKLAMRTA